MQTSLSEKQVSVSRLTVAWWNTSLSPPIRKEREITAETKAVALSVVKALVQDLKVDFLGLCEVTEDDLHYFKTELKLSDYDTYHGTAKGQLLSDTGAIYNKTKLELSGSTQIFAARGDRNLKVANRLDILALNLGVPIHFFISHWPSRTHCPPGSADRQTLGMKLREAVDEVKSKYKDDDYIILLGDYNDEPYDSSLAEQLLAVRDRNLVNKKKTRLYNPFWRHLGEALPYVKRKPMESISGTCFYSTGLDTLWRTFDQIIFSSSFLGQTEVHLNEELCQILPLQPFLSHVKKTSTIFDHLPVVSVVEKEDKND